MSESNSAKKLKQLRLPFAPLTSPAASTTSSPKIADQSSPKTSSVGRKRKTSDDIDNQRSNKIGRKSLKENIETKKSVIEIIDTDGEETKAVEVQSEPASQTSLVSPDSSPEEDKIHIKLNSCTKKKLTTDSKPQTPDEEDPESSIVYLDSDELKGRKKSRKSARKSVKKKKKSSSGQEVDDVSENLEDEKVEEKTDDKVAAATDIVDIEKMEVDESDEVFVVENEEPPASHEDSPKSFNTIPSAKNSTEKAEEQEFFNDDIADILTDASEDLNASTNSLKDDTAKNAMSKFIDITKLTPKQLARRQEFEARRLEKEKQKQKERDMREQQRLKEKELREDAKRKEREEKEEARRKEKEERDKKKQAELDKKELEKKMKDEERKKIQDQKDEEKRQKEEERKQKDEERKRQAELREEEKRQKEDDKRRKEQEKENHKKRAAQAFSKFFVKKPELNEDDASKDDSESGDGIPNQQFMPFQVRERMKLAPIVRLTLTKNQKNYLEEIVKKQAELSYLKELKSGKRKINKTGRTWQTDNNEDDIMVIDEFEGVGEDILTDETTLKSKLKRKFFLFTENRRPAYNGTWQKKTSVIKPRRPIVKDTKFFDYDVDSDEEWEEEEPGESLHGSDSEKEKEDEDDYEVDNDFMVPHGHLSDEEIKQMSDDEDNSPETQKAKMKIMQQEFAEQMKKKTEKIKPRLIGCIWMNGNEDENGASITDQEKKYHCTDVIWKILKAREAWSNEDSIEIVDVNEVDVVESEEEVEKIVKTPQTKQQPKAKFNDKILRDLVRLIHGNVNSKKFLIKEFQAYRLKNFHKDSDFLELTVKSVEEKFLEISEYKSCPDDGVMFGKKCWYVKPDIMKELFADMKLQMPNEWKYTLEKEIKEKKKPTNSEDKTSPKAEDTKKESPKSSASKKRPQPTLIVNETHKQNPPTNASVEPVKKKRVQLLMSVPIGETVNETKKNEIMSQFLKKSSIKTSTSVAAATKSKEVENEDGIVVLD